MASSQRTLGSILILALDLDLDSEAKAFRALRESLFFERQRKVTKRKPPYGPPAARARRVRKRGGNFRKAHPCAVRKRRTSCASPCGFTRHACRTSRDPKGKISGKS